MKKPINHGWTRHESHPSPVFFSARPRNHQSFSGTAEIFRYTGDHPYIAGAALVRFTAPEASAARSLMASYSGGVAEAVLLAAGLRRVYRLAPVGIQYDDLGGPVGVSAESLRDGSGVFKIVFYRKK